MGHAPGLYRSRDPQRSGTMTPRRVISHETAVAKAALYFVQHGTVDLDALATTLAVSRATLYRVVGSRTLLLGHVLWMLCEMRLDAARGARTLDGLDGIVEVTRHFAAGLPSAKGLIHFVTTESELADQVLYSTSGVVHPRLVAAQKEIFLEAGCGATPDQAVDLDRLAYLYIRLAEATLYAELLYQHQPDLGPSEKALRTLLTEAWPDC
jgi:hypothetical protein